MKKIALWLLSTVSAVVLMLGYHTSTSGVLATSAPTSIYSGTSSGSTNTGTGSTTTKGNPAPSSTPTPASTIVKGSVAPTAWGDVQVALTVQNHTITKVDVPIYPNGNGTDAQINSYALPVLIQETLAAQSAHIDMISGATITSGGYLQSLQSALDQAGL